MAAFSYKSLLLATVFSLAIGLSHGAFAAAEQDSTDAKETHKAPPLKPILNGLISMGAGGYKTSNNDNAAFHGIPGNMLDDVEQKRNAFDGVVINIPWKEIQPTAGSFNSTAIDAVLSNIRQYNSDPATTLPLRAILRIWAADNSPDWVKTMDGDPVTVIMPGPGGWDAAYTIPHFWSKNYQVAWRTLQRDLARKYDSEPLIAEVSNTSCNSTDDEWPALAWVGDAKLGISSINNLHKAGFNDAEFKKCLSQSTDDYDGWETTRVNLIVGAFRPTDAIKDYQVPPRDYAVLAQLMHKWKDQFRERAVFANHILNYVPESTGIPVYALMKQFGIPLEFQTHSPNGLDWQGTVDETVCIGGNALELWNDTPQGGYKEQFLSTLMRWSHELKDTTTNETCSQLHNKFNL